MDDIKFTRILVEVDGNLKDLTDLPKEQYEEFLELMQSLIIAYKALTRNNYGE